MQKTQDNHHSWPEHERETPVNKHPAPAEHVTVNVPMFHNHWQYRLGLAIEQRNRTAPQKR